MIDFYNEPLFRQDSTKKDIVITGQNIELGNSDICSNKVSLLQPLCTEPNLTFGSCESACFKFTTWAISNAYKGKKLNVTSYLNDDIEHIFEYGDFYVQEENLSEDRRKKEIVAYDQLSEMHKKDVAAWYNNLIFPMVLKNFRTSFFLYVGMDIEDTTLVNDNMVVEKTIDVKTLAATDVAHAILEINGVFGHMRGSQLRFIELPTSSAAATYHISKSDWSKVNSEDYTCQAITRLQMRQTPNDVGIVVGTEGNDYIIEDNFLLYGKTNAELTTIANNLLSKIANRPYVPFNVKCIHGNPCVEVGDKIEVEKKDGTTFTTFLLQRELTGLQALKDDMKATGPEYFPQKVNGINYEIKQLKGKTTEIYKTVEGIQVQISDIYDQIDGDIEYYERVGEPTLLNYPYWDFTTSFKCDGTKKCAPIYNADMSEGGEQYPHFFYSEQDRKNHKYDICYDTDSSAGYRFVYKPPTEGAEYQWFWEPITNSDYNILLQRTAALEATAEQLSSEYQELSLELQGDYYTKVQTDSKISQSASQIQTTVSQTYATKSTTNSLQSQITQQASQIAAKVSQTGGNNQSFGWSLTSSAFDLYANGNRVFRCNANGISINGSGEFTGTIRGATIVGGTLMGNFTMGEQADFTNLFFQGSQVYKTDASQFYAFTSAPTLKYDSSLGGYVPVFSSAAAYNLFRGLSQYGTSKILSTY